MTKDEGYGIGAKSYYNGLPVEGDSGRLFSWAQNMADKDNENERFNLCWQCLAVVLVAKPIHGSRHGDAETPFGEQPNRDMVINYLGGPKMIGIGNFYSESRLIVSSGYYQNKLKTMLDNPGRFKAPGVQVRPDTGLESVNRAMGPRASMEAEICFLS